MALFKKTFDYSSDKDNYKPQITIEKILHIFEYGKLEGIVATESPELSDKKLGRLIRWESESEHKSAYKDMPERIDPPHIKWYSNPYFAYVAIVNDKVQYHYGENGESTIFLCPQTTDINCLKMIDELFEHYYQKFGLPNILDKLKTVQDKADKTDKMRFLSEYLASKDENFFYENFYDDDIYEIAMWIDWREEDENIITYCEDILQTNQLSVEVFDAENERGCEVIITYKDKRVSVPYQGIGTDRDTTLKTLNEIICPDYEIRLCEESVNGDTLCFVPLSKEQWNELDAKFAEQVENKFSRINSASVMFDS